MISFNVKLALNSNSAIMAYNFAIHGGKTIWKVGYNHALRDARNCDKCTRNRRTCRENRKAL